MDFILKPPKFAKNLTMTAERSERPGEAPKKPARRHIPNYLVREVIDGIPFYYRGYRDVLNKSKTLEDIISDSGLQAILKDFIGDLLKAGLDRKKWKVIPGEVGNHLSHRHNLGLDVTVFDKTVLTPDKITTKFIEVPATMVVEIDVNVELPDPKSDLFQEYVVRKIGSLFSFGTQKVVWIFTKSQMLISATPTAPWQFYKWQEDVELMDGVVLNVGKYLEEEGINPEILL